MYVLIYTLYIYIGENKYIKYFIYFRKKKKVH